jgi:hypothetical protein
MSCQVAFALTDTQEIRYNATITDSAQIKTEVSNITFEFKEKHLPQGVIFGIPETFEHQYEHIPVTKGRGTLFVDFGKIEKMYDVKKGKEIFPKATLVLIDGQTITGVIGNEGEFGYCIVGDFEFGKFSIELSKLNSILFDVASNQKVPIDIYRRHVIDEKGIATPHLSFKILDKENIETIIHGYRLFRIEDGYNHKDVKEVFPIKYGESIYEIDPTQIAKIANFISTGDQLRVTLVTNTGKEYAGMIPSYEDLYFGGFTNIGFFQIPCTEILSIEKAETKSEISPRQDPRPE